LWQLLGTSLASTSRVADFLDKEALLRRDEKGGIIDVDWLSLLFRWSEELQLPSQQRRHRGLRA
jgi:hypothetical protein